MARRDGGEKKATKKCLGTSIWKNQKYVCFPKLYYVFMKKKDRVGAVWLKLGNPERFMGHMQRPRTSLTYKCKSHQLFMTGNSLPECHKASVKKHNIVWSWLASKIRKAYITILELLELSLQKHVSSDSSSRNMAKLLRDIRFEVMIVISYIYYLMYNPQSTWDMLIYLFSEHFYVSDRLDIIYILYMRKKDTKDWRGNMARPKSY